jgi:2-polyprenyl-3-methyl-5-hydroxy-6-metoxy-1,4-benzoquinol methylase
MPKPEIAESELVKLQQTLYSSKNPTRRWLHCTRRDWIINAIEQAAFEGRNERALEIGPGSGIYLPILANHFKEVIASDIESDYLKYAETLKERHSNLHLLIDDITNTQLPTASFDVILCTEVIEHIPNSRAALASMKRLLKPNGVLILSTPQKWSPLEVAAKIAFLPGIIDIVRLIYREPILETGHINLLTEKQATRQLQQAGFNICKRYKSGLYIPLIAEFTGNLGLKLEKWLESKLYGGPLDWLLWTQYYIAKP